MVWDKTKPADTDLISDSASDLRANNDAIETGDSSLLLDKINLQEQASDPGAITGSTAAEKAFRLYAKTDSDSGQTELFGIDDGGNVIQFSEGGLLGARDIQGIFQDITIGSNSFVNNQNNFVTAYGVVSSSGSGNTFVHQKNLASVSRASNIYTIKTDTIFANANVAVAVTPFRLSSKTRIGSLSAVPTFSGGEVTIKCGVTNSSGDWRGDVNFHVLIVGGF